MFRKSGAGSTLLLTIVAMLAFAANSLLCRLALGQGLIDAASFASVRLISGAVLLSLLVMPRWLAHGRAPPDWRSVTMLFSYMAFFSFAYISLEAGTGALILFGAVQLTMFSVALRNGEQFPLFSWIGLILAIFGLVFLVSPGLAAPDPFAAILMIFAGIAWGFYSLLGRGATDPLGATANSFLYSVPLAIICSLLFLDDFQISSGGLVLAASSGAIASGLGYAIWYAALPGLSATRAATVQLSVPVITAFGGILILSEQLSIRLLVASAATLGGVAIVLSQRATQASPTRHTNS